MANITRGFTFSSGDLVTAAKLHSLVDSASVSGVTQAAMSSGSNLITSGGTAPGSPAVGQAWWDTSTTEADGNGILKIYDGTRWQSASKNQEQALTNRSGESLTHGDVVVLNTSADNSVTTTTTEASTDFLGIAATGTDGASTIGDQSEGRFVQSGLVVVNTTGTVARGDYLGTLKLSLNQIKLSVTKSLKLSPDLVGVRKKLGLSLIAFEDAQVDLDPFVRVHPFETINFLTNSVVKHYTDELLSQAVLILGATDFLGNPIGFFNDLSEGVSGLVSEGDVGGLIKNVAHGAANSAAKVTGSLSYGISKATVYDKYNEKRLMLRRKRGDQSKEYLVDGLKGLGFGVFQGLTSIVTETYEGVASDGLSGLFSGLTWGLIGTVSKPALGVLDLATGTQCLI